MRRQHGQSDDHGQRTPCPSPTIPHATHQCPECGGQQRADEQFSVVSGRRVRRDGPAEQVREPAHEGTLKSNAGRAQEADGEHTGQKRVQHEAPRHGDVRRQHETEQERGVEDVPVHGRDVRHATELIRIPLRKSLAVAKGASGELAKGIPRDVLIRIGIYEKGTAKRWPRQEHRRDKADERRQRHGKAR